MAPETFKQTQVATYQSWNQKLQEVQIHIQITLGEQIPNFFFAHHLPLRTNLDLASYSLPVAVKHAAS